MAEDRSRWISEQLHVFGERVGSGAGWPFPDEEKLEKLWKNCAKNCVKTVPPTLKGMWEKVIVYPSRCQ